MSMDANNPNHFIGFGQLSNSALRRYLSYHGEDFLHPITKKIHFKYNHSQLSQIVNDHFLNEWNIDVTETLAEVIGASTNRTHSKAIYSPPSASLATSFHRTNLPNTSVVTNSNNSLINEFQFSIPREEQLVLCKESKGLPINKSFSLNDSVTKSPRSSPCMSATDDPKPSSIPNSVSDIEMNGPSNEVVVSNRQKQSDSELHPASLLMLDDSMDQARDLSKPDLSIWNANCHISARSRKRRQQQGTFASRTAPEKTSDSFINGVLTRSKRRRNA